MPQIKLYGKIAYHVIKVVIRVSCKCCTNDFQYFLHHGVNS